jgi:hypothetical protein
MTKIEEKDLHKKYDNLLVVVEDLSAVVNLLKENTTGIRGDFKSFNDNVLKVLVATIKEESKKEHICNKVTYINELVKRVEILEKENKKKWYNKLFKSNNPK